MTRSIRTALTLLGCALLVIGAATWGWSALTKPLPSPTETAACEPVEVKKGAEVFPAQVVVNVLNDSPRSGLADRTLAALTDEGFVAGRMGNAPQEADVQVAQIWTVAPGSPAVQLVKSWLPNATVKKKKTDELGVVVVVGKEFTEVGGGKKSVVAERDTTICSPPADPAAPE